MAHGLSLRIMKRRDFLQAVGCSIAALGISETGLFQSALAQPTPRKLALLVGINKYAHAASLGGCLTDLELQKELLIHRFGFKNEDILTLCDRTATRSQIERAFIEHLTAQAQPGDVVVFHFSGYGRRLQLNSAEDAIITNSLVAVDSIVNSSTLTTVNDLLLETLWLLVRSLRTVNVTTILDTSFHAPPPNTTTIAANVRFRSAPSLQSQLSTEALDFQEQLANLCTTRAIPCQYSYLPGLLLTAAKFEQIATEVQWTGFSSGLFTHALTQYLWEATPATSVQVSLSRVSSVVEQIVSQQQPQLSGEQQFGLPYHLMPDNVSADGVVKLVDDHGAQVWLAGLQPLVLQYYGVNSQLQVVSSVPPLQLQVRSRTGLLAKVQSIGDGTNARLESGQLVQEVLRVLPRHIHLHVALDAGLERIERVDATSAFAAIAFVSVVSAADQPVDCLFGRVPESDTAASTRYALFAIKSAVIADTAGEAGEAVKIAVQRLVPKLQALLAAKLWRLTTNETSSRLGVKSNLELISPQKSVVMQQQTRRGQLEMTLSPQLLPTTASIPSIPIGSRIQYQIYNQSASPIYYLIVGFDNYRNAIMLYPQQNTDPASKRQDLEIAAGECVCSPGDYTWMLHAPASICETQIVCSTGKFTQTLAALHFAGDTTKEEHIGTLPNSLAVAQAILQDLHNASNALAPTNDLPTDIYAFNVNAWASFNFIYQVS